MDPGDEPEPEEWPTEETTDGFIIVWPAWAVDEADRDKYPHNCPHCDEPAYIRGNNTVDCSGGCDGAR